jgi:FkbM family methyltransferase
MKLKRWFKQNTHNAFFKALAGFGRSMNRLYENRNHDIYSNGELVILKKLAKFNPAVIFDGGANIGKYSHHLNNICCDSKVYAFEPVKETYEKLVNNIRDYKNTTSVNMGLYHENCVKKINLYPSDTHSSVYDIQALPYEPTGTIEIKLIKGDDFVKENNIKQIDFLKLDLEGAEYDALVGFENSFRAGIIKMVQLEYGYINITTKKLLIDYYNFFHSFGYKFGKIFPKYVEFRDYNYKYEDFIGVNYIAVKKSEINLIDELRKK